jgi:hypothetical protein
MTPFPEREKDTLSKRPELLKAPEPSQLPDNKMINEGYKKDPGNFWAWILIVAAISALIWGTLSQYSSYMQEAVGPHPFLHVTNREMSRFLWQNPEFMRANVRMKTGYLPAFTTGDGTRLDPALADEWAMAPPGVLFRYHVWDRLVGGIWFPRPIPAQRFMAFLQEAPQWAPTYWKGAPASYVDFIASLDHNSNVDLAALQLSTLPQEVRVAFQAWQNFQHEGKQIEALQPTYADVKQFLEQYPTYRRPYWQNIVDTNQARYLGSLATHTTQAGSEENLPREEIPPFLRIALYNAQESSHAKANQEERKR